MNEHTHPLMLRYRYGFAVFKDKAITDIACTALNGMNIQEKTLTVRRATQHGQSKADPAQNAFGKQMRVKIIALDLALQAGAFSHVWL